MYVYSNKEDQVNVKLTILRMHNIVDRYRQISKTVSPAIDLVWNVFLWINHLFNNIFLFPAPLFIIQALLSVSPKHFF